jgi:hypothetical protein
MEFLRPVGSTSRSRRSATTRGGHVVLVIDVLLDHSGFGLQQKRLLPFVLEPLGRLSGVHVSKPGDTDASARCLLSRFTVMLARRGDTFQKTNADRNL